MTNGRGSHKEGFTELSADITGIIHVTLYSGSGPERRRLTIKKTPSTPVFQ